jgi:hypothetical protein
MAGRPWYPPQGVPHETYTARAGDRVHRRCTFVLSGSDDGNVRVWKANASEKLGIVTARERSAIEYHNALKERWKMDAEIGKVQQYAHSRLIDPAVLYGFTNMIHDIGVGIYRNPCTKAGQAAERTMQASRRGGGGGIRAWARANPRRNGRKWSSRNRANILYYRCVVTFPHTCMTRSVRSSMTCVCTALAVI